MLNSNTITAKYLHRQSVQCHVKKRTRAFTKLHQMGVLMLAIPIYLRWTACLGHKFTYKI